MTGLACADTTEVEYQRAAYIRSHMPDVYVGACRTSGIALKRGIKVLEGALAIGRQAEPPTADIAQARMDAVRHKADTATERTMPPAIGKAAKVPLFAKVTSWLAKAVEPAN